MCIRRARQARWVGLIAAAGYVSTAAPLASHFFQNNSFQPFRWQSLPVTYFVDGGPTDISGELDAAADVWNDVATAQTIFAMTPAADASNNPLDFTAANFETAWGQLTGDGRQEVVFDEDGSILMALGLTPARVNGFGPSRQVTTGGQAVINDAFLVINGSRTNFDRRATEIHELGHTVGLAHSSVGMHNSSSPASDALDRVSVASVPTMHPFSTAGTGRRTLEADDRAGISFLYPSTTFASSTGVIEGTVTRCSGDALTGVNVRAVNTANPAIQITRYTGFDGNSDGRYRIVGVPLGTYRVIIEAMGANGFDAGKMSIRTRIDLGFPTEYFSLARTRNALRRCPMPRKQSVLRQVERRPQTSKCSMSA